MLSGVLLIATGSGALAAEPQGSGWYTSGGFEAGARAFIEFPPRGFGGTYPAQPYWLTPETTDSRAKFWEYGQVQNYFVDYFNMRIGSLDGRYRADFWANNIGYDNQSYYLDLSEAGKQYLTLGWDQTPHLLSTSAKSIFSGVGTDRLTVDTTSRTILQSNLGSSTGGGSGQTQAQRNAIDTYIATGAPISNIELKTQRDKFLAAYRLTPTDDWDFKTDYSHEHRWGVRPLGIGYGYTQWTGVAPVPTPAAPRPSSGSIEVPQPIDDVTQNVNASGQYVGSSPFGRWNAAVKYSGSFYDNDIKKFDIDNPFCVTCAPYNGGAIVAGTQYGPNLLRYSLPPSNNAQAITANFATDIPIFKSRYMGTYQYTAYRQNDAFIDSVTNGVTTLAPLPAASLNGQVDALLVNNIVTSRFSDDLTNTARLRYYDVMDRTTQLVVANYMYGDGGTATTQPLSRARQSYTKLNISEELKWRARSWLTIGGEYFFERVNLGNGEVENLTENGGKVFVDATLFPGVTSRSSYLFSTRRYGQYEDTGNMVTQSMRLYMVANRDRQVARNLIEINVLKDLTVSPNGGLRFDDFPDDVANQFGAISDHGWNMGLDVGIRLSPTVRLTFSYNHEENERHIQSCCGTSAGVTNSNIPSFVWNTDIKQSYNTYIAALDWKAIPDKLDFKFEYLAAHALEGNETLQCSSGNVNCTGLGAGVYTNQFPDETNLFQRFSVLARYFVDPQTVRSLGWKGDVVAKLRYTWEQNHNVSWATDTLTPYTPQADQTADLTGGGRSLFLAYNNPNYTAQFIGASLAVTW